MGAFAVLIGGGRHRGLAIRTRRRRAEIAATYGATGGIVYTVVQAGVLGPCLVIGGLGLIVFALLLRR